MKTGITVIILALTVIGQGFSQTFTEKINQELSFEKKGTNNALMIFNINGDIKVEGYAGDKILVEVTKKIDAKTSERLDKGKQEIQLGVMDRADTLILYVKGMCNDFGKVVKKNNKRNGGSNRRSNGYGYNWNDCWGGNCERDKEYEFKMSFVIKVPMGVNLFASTINDGNIDVSSMNAGLVTENINGSISLKDISGATYASTINGDVTLNYVNNPPADSRYYTLNGDINANFKKGLGAQLAFKSFNGGFYSSIENISPMAVSVEKYEKSEGIHYKVNGNRYKVRQGGPLLDFETFNGDVFLKEL